MFILLYFYFIFMLSFLLFLLCFTFLFLSFSVDLMFQRSLSLTEKLSEKCKNFPYISPPLLQSMPHCQHSHQGSTYIASDEFTLGLHIIVISFQDYIPILVYVLPKQALFLGLHCESSCYIFTTNLKICYFKFLYIIYYGIYIIHKLLQF